MTAVSCFTRNSLVGCHGEAARSLLAKVRGDVFARFHAVAAKRRSRTRNSQFGLLGPLLRATATSLVQPSDVTRTQLPSAICEAPPENEQVMLETCRDP
jgi:hypothetical protein